MLDIALLMGSSNQFQNFQFVKLSCLDSNQRIGIDSKGANPSGQPQCLLDQEYKVQVTKSVQCHCNIIIAKFRAIGKSKKSCEQAYLVGIICSSEYTWNRVKSKPSRNIRTAKRHLLELSAYLNYIILGIKLFCFSRQKAATFNICLNKPRVFQPLSTRW